jgi:hypothetical protein
MGVLEWALHNARRIQLHFNSCYDCVEFVSWTTNIKICKLCWKVDKTTIFGMWSWKLFLKRLIKAKANSCKKLQQNEYLQTHMTSSCTFSYSKWFCLVHSSKICCFGKGIYGLLQFDLVG